MQSRGFSQRGCSAPNPVDLVLSSDKQSLDVLSEKVDLDIDEIARNFVDKVCLLLGVRNDHHLNALSSIIDRIDCQ